MSGEDELMQRAKMSMEILDEAFSSEDEDNMAQPKEIEDEEDAARKSEFAKDAQVRVEDLTNEPDPVTTLIPIDDRDWPKRMADFSYTQRQRAFVEKCLQKKQDMVDFKNHFEW